jgi:hypothetical protein
VSVFGERVKKCYGCIFRLNADNWLSFLGRPSITKQLAWSLGNGSALEVRADREPAIVTMKLQVASVARSQDVLTRLGVQVEKTDDGLSSTIPQTRGLQMHVTETRNS